MNKSQLVEGVAAQLLCSRLQAGRLVESVLGSINDGLEKDGKVAIVGFGTFRRSMRKARIGRNPITGEALSIPASQSVRFVVSKGSRLRGSVERVRG